MFQCSVHHSSCQKKARHSQIFCTDNAHLITDLSGEGLVPSRLLVFPLSPSSLTSDNVSIVLSTSLSADTQYIALSHRWGTNETCRTTCANLDRLTEKGIPTVDLPLTFREAVQVARGLGYSYIWIDSLCIVQDDQEDWKAEAQRMAIIYDNAVCTIAAMDGADSDSGLL
ncbi:heterokaryon incompatibility protein-domain-containing protein, partial [Xylogone sp. PMI_703]